MSFYLAEQKKIEGVMMSLRKELAGLAPHPDSNVGTQYDLGQRQSISPHFNSRVTWKNMMGKYLKDLPRRLGIERWIAEHQRRLYAMQKNVLVPTL